jgi:hypothetical protein
MVLNIQSKEQSSKHAKAKEKIRHKRAPARMHYQFIVDFLFCSVHAVAGWCRSDFVFVASQAGPTVLITHGRRGLAHTQNIGLACELRLELGAERGPPIDRQYQQALIYLFIGRSGFR